MIILYDKNEKTFTSLGLGVLTDATSCLVIEELNGAFELEMEYPITGIHYKDILEERIIVAPPNDTMQPQPFRIYKITKPIDGIVTVYGQHISYDTSKVPVRAIAAENLDQVAEQMNSRKMVNSPFIFVNGKGEDNQTFLTKVPYSFRSLLAGTTGSILDKFGGEFIFDRYNITLVERRGTNRDFVIRYSKNMTDLEQETSTELMYDGVCPYYCNTITETKPSLAGRYKEIYISTSTVEPKKDAETGDTLYPSEWLTYNQNGIGIPEILSFAVTNIIANEGQFYNHLVRAKKTKAVGDEEEHDYFYDVTYNMSFIDRNYADEFGRYWLYKDEELTEGWDPEEYDNEKKYYKYRWNPEGLPIGSEPGQWDPEKNKDKIFRVYTQNDKLYKVYLWKFDETLSAYRYQEPADADKVNKYSPVLPSLSTVQEEKDNIILYEGDIIYVNEVRAQPSGLLVEEYGRYWLKEVKELLQILRTDPRWEAGEVIQPKKGVTYKVIQKEEYIQAYVIPGAKEYTSGWLTDTEGSDVPLTPVNNQGYIFDRPSDGKTFYYRWNDFDNKYIQITDTRYSYVNYIWNGTRYVEKDTSVDAIMTLDLSDKFKETPTDTSRFQKQLYEEAIKYIKENKIGQLKDSIKVSFIKLSQSEEYSKWKELEKVALGDTVTIIFDEAGVNVQKKVCKTEYNVLKESYDTIELGDKASQFTNNAVVEGDDISSFTNNRNFADVTTVTKLVAEVVTADLIQAVNAEITEAQIKTLTSESISATLIEAERFEIDKLVAGLLVAKDAYISEALTAGEVIVNGEINVRSGSISITGRTEEVATVKAYVNDDAQEYDLYWLKENPDSKDPLTPDKLTIYEVYEYYNKAELFIGYFKWNNKPEASKYEEYVIDTSVVFEVDANGKLTANEVDIAGKITAKSGDIGGCIIVGAPDEYIDAYVIEGTEEFTSGWLTDTEGSTTPLTPQNKKYYRVYYDGMQRYYTWNSNLLKYEDELVGILQVDGANISGTLNAVNIVSSDISASNIISTDISASTITASRIVLSDDQAETEFSVNEKGNLKANAVELEGGTIENLVITGDILFGSVDETPLRYEIRGNKEKNTRIAMFGKYREGYPSYYRTQLAIELSKSRLRDGFDYVDYVDPDDPTAKTQYTHFLENRSIKIWVHRGSTVLVKSVEDPEITLSGWYSITINGSTTSNLIGENESEPAEYDQYMYVTAKGTATLYHYIIIDDIQRKYNWLSANGPDNPEDYIRPKDGEIYDVIELNGKHQLYKWDENQNLYTTTDHIFSSINEDGINMPGFVTTKDGTIIAGFDIDEYTMTSISGTKQVGISSADCEQYAFWAGTSDSGYFNKPPFYVTHLGELCATKGHIANFVIDTNTIHAEDKDSIDSDEDGLYLGDDGFAFKGSYDTWTEEGTYVDPATHSNILLKANGKYGESYISNVMLYNPSQMIYTYPNRGGYYNTSTKTWGPEDTPIPMPIATGFSSYAPYTDEVAKRPIMVISLTHTLYLNSHVWSQYDWTIMSARKPDEYTVAYVISGTVPYTSGWLTDTEGSTTPITPQAGVYYHVESGFYEGYYEWNTEDLEYGAARPPYKFPWNNILAIHASIISNQPSGSPVTEGNIDVWWDNQDEGPFKFAVFNGTSSRQQICITLIVERKDVKDPDEDL